MKLKRVAGKGKRWKRGQSCVSNPENTQHRAAAKGRFFQKVEGPSSLTQDALAKHEAALNNDIPSQMEQEGITPDDLQSAGKSCKTFATNFTTCTIPAFEKFFNNFSVNSERHTRMLAIHAAAQEYMHEAGMPETSTSYFCSVMTSLEGISDSEEDVAAALALLGQVMRRVNIDVLRAKFSDFAKTLDNIITLYQNTSNGSMITNVIGCLSVLLRAQDRSQWTYSYTMNLFQKIMAFTVHEKPKVRKPAHYNVAAILQGSSFMVTEGEEPSKVIHPAAAEVAEFCSSQLRAAGEMGNTKSVLHILVLLRQVLHCFPKKQLKTSCETILSAMQLGNTMINTCAMQALYSLLVTKPSTDILPAQTNAALITALTTGTAGVPGSLTAIIPSMNDSQPACAWITLLSAALMNLFSAEEAEGMRYMVSWFTQLASFWESNHKEVQSKVNESFEVLLEECLGNCSEELKSSDNFQAQVQSIFQVVEGGMSLQYQTAWPYVFKTLNTCFHVIGPIFPDMLIPCVRNLTELMNNPQIPGRRFMEDAVGAAVRSMGPEVLLKVVPLEISGSIADDEKNFWILPLLKKYVSGARLTFFEDFFVHLAGKCFVIINALKEKGLGDSILAKGYQTVENQIWRLLPSFCNKAKDVEQALSNQKFARILCDHIKFRDDTRIDVMTALRNLIKDNLENPGKLTLYAKNYIPALFNIYLTKPRSKDKHKQNSGEATVENGQRLAAFSTIKTYLKIVPKPKCDEFLNLVMTKYNAETEEFKKQAFLDLARAFIPYMDMAQYQRMYEKVKVLFSNNTNRKEQKAAYRMLEEMLAEGSETSVEFISANLNALYDDLLKSLSTASPGSRAPRLRCIRHVLANLKKDMEEEKRNNFLNQVVAESVMCSSKGMSEATRKAAFLIMSEVGHTIQKHMECSQEDTVRHTLKLLLAGLVGSPMLARNSIICIASLCYQYKDIIPKDVLDLLMNNMCVQLLCKSREIVGACLSFINHSLIIFKVPLMSDFVETILKGLCNMNADTQRKFRTTTRDILAKLIRKFGSDRITALVPEGDLVIQKRLRNLRKLEARKKREKEASRDVNYEEYDEDKEDEAFMKRALPPSLDEILAEIETDNEDDDDEENDGKKKKKKVKGKKEGKKKERQDAWIKEDEDNIVDLLDPSAGQSVVSQRPIMKAKRTTQKKSSGFEVDKKTGRLIITDGEEKKEQKESQNKMEIMEDLDELLNMKAGARDGKVKNRKRTMSAGSDEEDEPPAKVSGKGPSNDKSKRLAKNKRHTYGQEFRSKKARGDMMTKGKVQPYAYVQFTKDRLNKRKKAKYEGQFASLVKGAKKGVAKGSKARGKTRGKGKK